jgi:PKD repeat protein
LVDAGGGITTTTGATGLYTLTMSPGLYTVTASADGYYPETVPGLALVSGTVVQNFALEPLPCPTPTIMAVQVITADLTATFSPTVSGPVDYLWAFGDGLTGTLAVPSHTYAMYGTYSFTLTVTNACGSDAWHGTVVLPAPQPQWKLYLPVVYKGGGAR